MLTRQEHLQFCKTCKKRKFNPQYGIICSLTVKIADFEETCVHYENDVYVAPVQPQKQVKPPQPAKKRVKETISKTDIYLLIGMVLATTFAIRFSLYANKFNEVSGTRHFFFISWIGLTIALLIRNKSYEDHRLFSDLKFKGLFMVMLTWLNLFYLLVVYEQTSYLGITFLSFLFLSLVVSMLTIFTARPLHYIHHKIFARHAPEL